MTNIAILAPPPSASAGYVKKSETDALFKIIYGRSFGRGATRLSSGRQSNFYFDMKPSMLDPEGAHLMAKILLREVTDVTGEYVGGLEMGAVPITGAVCAHSYSVGAPVKGFFVRKKAKEHGAKKLVEGLLASESLAGKRLVIVEDVTTTGASALQAVLACQEAGAEVKLVFSIVDREEGAAETFAALGIPFKSLFQAHQFLNASA